MQSDPIHVSRNASSREPTPETSPTPTQHGIRDNQLPPLHPPGVWTGGSQTHSVGQDTSSRSSSLERVRSADDSSRLSPVSPPPRNRITEYENAGARERAESVLFEVVHTKKKNDAKSSPISKMPNGTSDPPGGLTDKF